MSKKLVFQLGAGAVKKLEALMQQYGETEPETLISRALGLLAAVQPYLHDGALTVVDPDAEEPAEQRSNAAHVDLVFERLQGRDAAHHAH
jgi:hypothetical protein